VQLLYYRGVLRGIAEYEAQQEEEGMPVQHSQSPQAAASGDGEKRVSDSAMLLHLAGDVEYAKADA
jgi:hypothetical protein